jgi:hypothetical protein
MPNAVHKSEATDKEFLRLSGRAITAARKKMQAAGLSMIQTENGYIVEVFPNGKRRRIKKAPPTIPVKRGLKIKFQ